MTTVMENTAVSATNECITCLYSCNFSMYKLHRKVHSVTILQAGKGLPCSFTSWFLVLCCDCWAVERRRRRMIICVLPRRSWWPLSQPHLFSPGGHTLQELRAGCCRAAVHVSPAKSAYSSPRHSTHHTVRKAGETATVSCTPVRYGKSGKTKKKKAKKKTWADKKAIEKKPSTL